MSQECYLLLSDQTNDVRRTCFVGQYIHYAFIQFTRCNLVDTTFCFAVVDTLLISSDPYAHVAIMSFCRGCIIYIFVLHHVQDVNGCVRISDCVLLSRRRRKAETSTAAPSVYRTTYEHYGVESPGL